MLKNAASSPEEQLPSQPGVKEKWKKCLEIVSEKIPPQGFKTWLVPIIPVNYVDEKLILRVPSQFFFEWIETHYQNLLQKTVKEVFGLRTSIEYLVATTPDKHPESMNLDKNVPSSTKKKAVHHQSIPHRIDSRYNFKNFLVHNDNELALRAAETVANQPGKTDYNPLFIYGDLGCGKTHLLHAIGNFILEKTPKRHIIYLSSEHFLNEFLYSLQHKQLEQFYKKYDSIDILLLDDIHFLTNKKKSQEGLFFLFSELERHRKQIVIASQKSPAHLVGFNSRLISFFQKGLIVDLISPSHQTRLKFIVTYSDKTDLKISPQVREFLAKSLTEGMQQLQAVMIRLGAQSSLLGKEITLEATKRLLSHIDVNWARKNGKIKRWKQIRIDDIIQTVSQYLNIPPDIITGYSRQREVSFARQVAVYLSKTLSGESLKVIGYHFGDRHYTGILHSCKKIEQEMKNNPAIYHLISELKSLLMNH